MWFDDVHLYNGTPSAKCSGFPLDWWYKIQQTDIVTELYQESTGSRWCQAWWSLLFSSRESPLLYLGGPYFGEKCHGSVSNDVSKMKMNRGAAATTLLLSKPLFKTSFWHCGRASTSLLEIHAMQEKSSHEKLQHKLTWSKSNAIV